jgi:protein gp37
MADNSHIEWTDATWNPVTGCTKITAGCDRCYAERFAERFRGVPGHPYSTGFDLTLRPERLEQPKLWKRPRLIFVNSMSDLFHKEIPDDYRGQVFDTMEEAKQHTYQVLTKRSSILRRFVNARYGASKSPSHIWLGVSVENAESVVRIRHLREAQVAVRFLSLEPLIGPLPELELDGIHWVIVGGESGPGARPMDPAWVRDIRDQCEAAGVAFFFKQWGGLRPKTGGRELDGREWNEYPAKGSPQLVAAAH